MNRIDICKNIIQSINEYITNLMAKPVDKARQIRYNFYGILCIWSYLIIPWITDSSESVFCFWT